MEIYHSQVLLDKYLDNAHLRIYLSEVQQANRHFNLYSRHLGEDHLRRLIAESLIPLELDLIGDTSEPLLDIGSGWGIPAVPLMLSGEIMDVTLLERSKKKADFLSLLIRRLDIAPEIVNEPLESFAPDRAFTTFCLRQVALDAAITNNIRRLTGPTSYLLFFGREIMGKLAGEKDVISYTIDSSDEKYIVFSKIQ